MVECFRDHKVFKAVNHSFEKAGESRCPPCCPHNSVAWIRKPGGAVIRMDNRIVGRIELLAFKGVGQDSDAAVVLIAHHASVAVLTCDLTTLEIESISVAVT